MRRFAIPVLVVGLVAVSCGESTNSVTMETDGSSVASTGSPVISDSSVTTETTITAEATQATVSFSEFAGTYEGTRLLTRVVGTDESKQELRVPMTVLVTEDGIVSVAWSGRADATLPSWEDTWVEEDGFCEGSIDAEGTVSCEGQATYSDSWLREWAGPIDAIGQIRGDQLTFAITAPALGGEHPGSRTGEATRSG